MSRMLNLVLGATAAITGGLAYKYYKDLEEHGACTCKQGGSPQPGQSSYQQMRLFYQKPMVMAWSPAYTGGMTDTDLYAEAQRVYQLQLQALQGNAEPKDAWERDGEIGPPPATPMEAVPVPTGPQFTPMFPESLPVPTSIGLTEEQACRMQERAGIIPCAVGDQGLRRMSEANLRRGDIAYAGGEGVRPTQEHSFQSPQSARAFSLRGEAERQRDFQRRKQEFESKYQGTYEEFLSLQEQARRAGRILKPTPKRPHITESRSSTRTMTY